MARDRRRQTFAQIVLEASEPRPSAEPKPHGPGFTPDGEFVDQTGARYAQVAPDLDPAQALAIARDGATVVWDSCGCGGYCPLTWFNADDVAAMVASGSPRIRRTKRRHGRASEWRADDGRVLLLLEQEVEWGDRLA